MMISPRPLARPVGILRASLIGRAGVAAVTALAVLVGVLSFSPASAQSTPSQLDAADLTYEGAFAFPAGNEWAYSGHAMTHVPAPTGPGTLVVGGFAPDQQVGEISIPDLVVTSNFADLERATVLRGLTDITGGLLACLSCESIELAGVEYLPAEDRIVWNIRDWYNVSADNRDTLGWSDRDFSNAEGRWHIGPRTNEFHDAKSTNYLFLAPSGFADEHLAGRTLIAGNHRMGGTFFGSQGPSMIATAPWQDQPLANGAELGATKLIDYPEIPLCLGDPTECAFPDYRPADEWGGGAWVDNGTVEGVMIVGRKGIGSTCYGTPGVATGTSNSWNVDDCRNKTTDLDTVCQITQGWHSGPYAPMMVFYSADDLADVAAGNRAPDSVVPVSTHIPTETLDDSCGTLESIAYDQANGMIYVAESKAGPWGETAVHVWSLGDGDPTATPTPTATATPTATPTVGPAVGDELVRNGDFSDRGQHWWSSGLNSRATTRAYCTTAPSSAIQPWAAQLGQVRIPVLRRLQYRLSFDIVATAPAAIAVNVQLPRNPWTPTLRQTVPVTTVNQSFSFDFTASLTHRAAHVIFDLGTGAENRYCIDNVSLRAISSAPVAPVSCSVIRSATEATIAFVPAGNDGADRYVVQRRDAGAGWAWIGRVFLGRANEVVDDVAVTEPVEYRVLSRNSSGVISDFRACLPFD